jgi:hypothetical protein
MMWFWALAVMLAWQLRKLGRWRLYPWAMDRLVAEIDRDPGRYSRVSRFLGGV